MPSPASRASSAVSSTGKPWVSCSSKTSPAWRFDSPCARAPLDEVVEQPRARLQRAARSAPPRPRAGGGRRRGARPAPGSRRPSDSITTSCSAPRNGVSSPRRLPCRTARRMTPAQDVAAALVGRRHAVGGDRRHAAAVVAEHAERAHRVAAVGVALARQALEHRDHVRSSGRSRRCCARPAGASRRARARCPCRCSAPAAASASRRRRGRTP